MTANTADSSSEDVRIRLLKWWDSGTGISNQPNGFYDAGAFTPSTDLSFAQQIGQSLGEGRYLLLSETDAWWREIKVEAAETYYREAE